MNNASERVLLNFTYWGDLGESENRRARYDVDDQAPAAWYDDLCFLGFVRAAFRLLRCAGRPSDAPQAGAVSEFRGSILNQTESADSAAGVFDRVEDHERTIPDQRPRIRA